MRRQWDEDELQMLEELVGHHSIRNIARIMSRSEESIKKKINRLGLGGFKDNSDMLTRCAVSRILGVPPIRISRWEDKGLKTHRKVKPFVLYDQRELIKFLEEHPDLWNARCVQDDSIFAGQEWFVKKKATDMSPQPFNWTADEVATLRFLWKQQKRNEEYIARVMNRTVASIRSKLYNLGGRL